MLSNIHRLRNEITDPNSPKMAILRLFRYEKSNTQKAIKTRLYFKKFRQHSSLNLKTIPYKKRPV